MEIQIYLRWLRRRSRIDPDSYRDGMTSIANTFMPSALIKARRAGSIVACRMGKVVKPRRGGTINGLTF
jgi:hypothetical protein